MVQPSTLSFATRANTQCSEASYTITAGDSEMLHVKKAYCNIETGCQGQNGTSCQKYRL